MEQHHTLFIMLSEFLALLRRLWIDVQVSSSIFTDDAAKIGKSVCVRKFFIINLDWSCVGGIQGHNFSLLAADVKANFVEYYSRN